MKIAYPEWSNLEVFRRELNLADKLKNLNLFKEVMYIIFLEKEKVSAKIWSCLTPLLFPGDIVKMALDAASRKPWSAHGIAVKPEDKDLKKINCHQIADVTKITHLNFLCGYIFCAIFFHA